MLVGLLGVMTFSIMGCKKKMNYTLFTYELNEDETEVIITGLTDKGKEETEITIPSKLDGKPVTVIGSNAFAEQTLLKKVSISDGVVTISENAFLNCLNLEDIDIPDSVKNIGTNAFTKTAWSANRLEDSNELIVNDILCRVKEAKGSYTIPDGVVKIASGVFYENTSLKGVSIPASVKSIESYAFSGCSELTEINLPEGLENIGYGAFSKTGIKKLKVPAGVKSIGREAFLGIDNVEYSGRAEGKPWGATNIQ